MTDPLRFDRTLGLALLLLLLLGCLAVLVPFVTALLLAVILVYATWPLNLRLRRAFAGWKLGSGRTVAASVMTLGASLVLLGPFIVLALSLADNATQFADAVRAAFEGGLPDLPAWVTGLPLVGESLGTYWSSFSHDAGRLMEELKTLIAPARAMLLSGGGVVIGGLFQLALGVLVAFFLYRGGETAEHRVRNAAARVGGDRAQHLLDVAGATVIGVVYGILGTALAQGVLATIGFLIAGVPGAVFLGLATFFLSIVPVGPPLVWLPAAAWLFFQGSTGWAVFMLLWGALVISLVDNFLKPMIISRGSRLPFILVLLGVLGGVVAFGFIGVFIGPTLLAVGYGLFVEWSSEAPEGA
jgi:predicted PurR-regulated permease PerM